jgi:hypothetical protein
MIATTNFLGRMSRPAAERGPYKISGKISLAISPLFPNSESAHARFCWEFVLQNVSIRDKAKKKNKKCVKRAGLGITGRELGKSLDPFIQHRERGSGVRNCTGVELAITIEPIFPNSRKPKYAFCWEFEIESESIPYKPGKKNKIRNENKPKTCAAVADSR